MQSLNDFLSRALSVALEDNTKPTSFTFLTMTHTEEQNFDLSLFVCFYFSFTHTNTYTHTTETKVSQYLSIRGTKHSYICYPPLFYF